MEGSHVLPRDSISIANKLQQVIHCVGKIIIADEIKPNSSYRYAHIVIERVDEEYAES